MAIRCCNCPGSLPEYEQLLRSNLFPVTLQKPRTAFTFKLLDDFIRDNLECGTSGSNYFSKLRRVTSNVFPHLVLNYYHELLRVTRKWCFLKLLKWNSLGHTSQKPTEGQLVLFCPACLQPRVNCHPSEDELIELRQDPMCSWKYTQTIVMDGNFKAEHMHERRPEDQVWLMDGLRYMVTRPEYRKYLKATHHPPEKSTCYNHQAHNMGEISRVISFYDINCNYMKNLRRWVCGSAFISSPEDIDITAGIGIWHVHGHRPECFSWNAPLFITRAGWELLDFQMNDSNFMKMI
ncbi:hypothetical protein OG21DRAFT_1479134 [Imleria badia]|nr:hypothetical protein OG21DRAFT_1479134 [Imleria badia]